HQKARPAVGLLGHERPLEAGRKSRAAAAAQARIFDLADDPVAPFEDQALGVAPAAARARAGQPPFVPAVEVGKDTVAVSEHQSPPEADGASTGSPVKLVWPPTGADPRRPTSEPGGGGSPRTSASSNPAIRSASRSS